ncbi:MAG TPA: hypothetical protein VF263_11235 [Longimicrobiaceae bacterium]
MRDIDREIGIGSLHGSAAADDAGAVERNRRIGERLLFADEVEETLETLRAGSGREELPRDTLEALERRARREREEVEALERDGRIDYDAVARAMPGPMG